MHFVPVLQFRELVQLFRHVHHSKIEHNICMLRIILMKQWISKWNSHGIMYAGIWGIVYYCILSTCICSLKITVWISHITSSGFIRIPLVTSFSQGHGNPSLWRSRACYRLCPIQTLLQHGGTECDQGLRGEARLWVWLLSGCGYRIRTSPHELDRGVPQVCWSRHQWWTDRQSH